jgi:hypothetical protein
MGNTSKADEGHIIPISLSNGRRKMNNKDDEEESDEELNGNIRLQDNKLVLVDAVQKSRNLDVYLRTSLEADRIRVV